MSSFLRRSLSVLLLGLASTVTATDLPPGCDSFTWDVTHELTLMQAAATSIHAGNGADNVVRIEPDTHYNVRLYPQGEITFAATPGKSMPDADAFAGLLTFQVERDGHYRVAITSRHWIDLVDGDNIIPSVDFQGHRACSLAHKIVQFDLHAGRDLTLQFAAGNAAEIGMVIVPAP